MFQLKSAQQRQTQQCTRHVKQCWVNVFMGKNRTPKEISVTADRWTAGREHTHAVRLEPGERVDLAFAQ